MIVWRNKVLLSVPVMIWHLTSCFHQFPRVKKQLPLALSWHKEKFRWQDKSMKVDSFYSVIFIWSHIECFIKNPQQKLSEHLEMVYGQIISPIPMWEPGFVFFSKHVLALSKMCMESSPTWKFNLQVNFMCFFQKKMNSFWSSIKLNHVREMLHSTQPYPNALQPFFIGSCPDFSFPWTWLNKYLSWIFNNLEQIRRHFRPLSWWETVPLWCKNLILSWAAFVRWAKIARSYKMALENHESQGKKQNSRGEARRARWAYALIGQQHSSVELTAKWAGGEMLGFTVSEIHFRTRWVSIKSRSAS